MGDGTVATLITFLGYLILLLSIGYWADRKFSKTYKDFVAAGKTLGAWVTAISASASAESAWVMLGLSGLGYKEGLAAYWAAFACILGYFINALWVMAQMRRQSAESGAITVSDFIESRVNDKTHSIRILSSLIILFFMTTYVVAQFVGSGKTLEGMNLLPYKGGVLVGAIIIGVYVLMGGYAAVCWTDLIQGLLMGGVMLMFPIMAIVKAGGLNALVDNLAQQGLLSLAGAGRTFLTWAGIGFVLGQLGIALGYPGMPHVIVRFITVKDEQEAKKAAFISMTWGIIVFFGSVTLGIAGRILFPALADPEKILPIFASTYLHPVIAGVILAAITAAIMSTADSQLMYAATTVINDLWLKITEKKVDQHRLINITRATIGILTLIAMGTALLKPRVIFTFVLYAWGALGAAFTPIILLSLYWKRFNKAGALASLIIGPLVVTIWHNIPSLANALYELVPAFILSLLAGIVFSLMLGKKDEM